METSHFHPMMVHFPVAIILLGFLAELCSWIFKKETWLPKASLTLLIIGTLAAIAGWLTGTFFTSELSGQAGEIRETHELFAQLTTGVMAIVCLLKLFLVWKKNTQKSLHLLVLVLYLAGAGLVAYTGFLGGTLVINYLIGL